MSNLAIDDVFQSDINDSDSGPGEIVAPARLLEYKYGRFAAFPAHTTMGLLARPRIVPVPGAPYYCAGMIAWEGRQIALMDLETLVRAYPSGPLAACEHVLVVAWQSAPGRELAYGAVRAPLLVSMIEVNDSMQCPLPKDCDLWPCIALSSFMHQGESVPILDTGRLFTAANC
ncbi:MAG: chemotaxis protein CheW [Ramlibacter sp.]